MATSAGHAGDDARDGLNEAALCGITAMALAARNGNATAFFGSAKGLKQDARITLLYARLLLGQLIVRRLGIAKPSDIHLRELVGEASLTLTVLGRFTDQDAELALRDVFSNSPTPVDGAPTDSAFLFYATALLGALSADPDGELHALRPYLARKCAQLADAKPETLGFLRPRSQ